MLEAVILQLDDRLLLLQAFNLFPLPLSRRVSGQPIADDTLDSSLFLLSFGLGSFSACN